jgi:hypothetical protein
VLVEAKTSKSAGTEKAGSLEEEARVLYKPGGWAAVLFCTWYIRANLCQVLWFMIQADVDTTTFQTQSLFQQ